MALDAPFANEEENFSPTSWLKDTRTEPLAILAQKNKEHLHGEGLENALAKLDERSREIVKARWLADEPATLHEMAAQFNVSAERIRQIEGKALEKMRGFLAPLVA